MTLTSAPSITVQDRPGRVRGAPRAARADRVGMKPADHVFEIERRDCAGLFKATGEPSRSAIARTAREGFLRDAGAAAFGAGAGEVARVCASRPA